MIPEWEKKADKAIRRLKWKFKLLKIKWGLLFVLPLLIIVLAYEAAKQYLKIRLRRWQVEAPDQKSLNRRRTPLIRRPLPARHLGLTRNVSFNIIPYFFSALL